MITKRWFTTHGPVRSGCGHRHSTIAIAAKCAREDQRCCERMGGYSDRYVKRTDNTPLTDDEARYALDCMNGVSR